MFLMMAVVCTVVLNSNSASAQHPGDSVARAGAANAMDAAMSALTSAQSYRAELETKISKAQRLAKAAAARGDRRLESKLTSKLDEYKADLEKANGRIEKIEEELAKRGCEVYTDPAVQQKCFDTLKAITADGEAKALEVYAGIVTPPPSKRIIQELDGKKTITEENNDRMAQLGYSKFMRCSGGDTPVCTEIQVGERAPIPPMQFQNDSSEESGGSIHPGIRYGLMPVACGLVAGFITSVIDPDGPDGDNMSYGAFGKGAAVGFGGCEIAAVVWDAID